jgi:hypothetical protein
MTLLHFPSTAERAVGILGALSSLTGDRASGSILVTADSGTVTIPKNATLFPIIPGAPGGAAQVDFTSPFRVQAQTVVTTTPTSVPLTSWIGGGRFNVEAGTRFVWWPSVAGVTETPEAVSNFSGGAQPTSECGLKSLTWWEEPSDPNGLSDDFLRAALRMSPGAVLGWSGSPTYKAKGNMSADRIDRWQLVIAVTDQRAHAYRSLVGLTILDLAEGLLLDRSSVDGSILSAPNIKILNRSRLRTATGGVYAYGLQFETTIGVVGLVQRDADHIGADWLRTSWSFPTMADETGTHVAPDELIDVAGPLEEPMP